MISIENKSNCCGCSACFSVCPKNCITMTADEEGFLYPAIDKSICVNCGMCEKVCPIINKIPEKTFHQEGYVVQHKDEKILKESTSGGAFTAIADYVIKQGGVVFGAAFDDNFNVVHTYVEKTEELAKFRNSKYVQSDMGNSFRLAKDFLQSGRLVCFSGTPCQIEGLKCFLQKGYDNLITVDVVCRAVPSPLIWEKYKSFKSKNDKIISAEFRSKSPFGYEYSQMQLTTDKMKYRSGVESDPYLRAFFSDLSDRPSCYECAFKKRYRESDITIWDCFESYKYDTALNNNKGVTKILIHSEKGNALFHNICNDFEYKKIDADYLVEGMKEMIESVKANKKRDAFFTDAKIMNDEDFFRKYFPDSMKVKIERWFRRILNKIGIYRQIKRVIKAIKNR